MAELPLCGRDLLQRWLLQRYNRCLQHKGSSAMLYFAGATASDGPLGIVYYHCVVPVKE